MVNSIIPYFIRFIGVIIGFSISIYIGNNYGASLLGDLNLFLRLELLITLFIVFGSKEAIIKYFNYNNFSNTEDKKKLISFLFRGYLKRYFISFIGIILFTLLLNSNLNDQPFLFYFLILTIILRSFYKINSSIQAANRNIIYSLIFENQISQFAFLLLLVIVNPGELFLILVCVSISRLINFIISSIKSVKYYGVIKFKEINVPQFYEIKEFLKKNFVTTISHSIFENIDIVILSLFVSSSELGVYAVCSRIIFLSNLLLQVTNIKVSPYFSELFSKKKIKSILILFKKNTIILSFLGFLQILVIYQFGDLILNFWGSEFVIGYKILIILAIGQFINLSTGICGSLLNMTGGELINRNLSLIFSFLLIINLFIFCEMYGILGAAYSVSLNLTLINIFKFVYCIKNLKLNEEN